MTATKWEIKEEADNHFGIYPEGSCDCIAVVWNSKNVEANARLICRAVNNHDKLIEALEICKAYLDPIIREKYQNGETMIEADSQMYIPLVQALAIAKKEI